MSPLRVQLSLLGEELWPLKVPGRTVLAGVGGGCCPSGESWALDDDWETECKVLREGDWQAKGLDFHTSWQRVWMGGWGDQSQTVPEFPLSAPKTVVFVQVFVPGLPLNFSF